MRMLERVLCVLTCIGILVPAAAYGQNAQIRWHSAFDTGTSASAMPEICAVASTRARASSP